MTGRGASFKSLGWLGLAGLGAVGGLFLGQFAVGAENAASGTQGSYADVTGNPQALAVDALPVEDCFGCFDSYGAAIRLRAMDDDRMGREFRELGAVAIDYGSEATDDYDYGGRFDDPVAAPTRAEQPILAMQSPVPVAATTQPRDGVDPKIVVIAVAPSSVAAPSPAPAQ